MNKTQTCGFLGWTSAEFDRNVSRGFPARKVSRSRGTDWQVDSREAVDWVAEQQASASRPRTKPAKLDFSSAPAGWQAFQACERLENPGEQVAMSAMLALAYAVPRLAANMAADVGATMEQTHKISVGMLLLLLEHARQTFDFWPKGDSDVPLLNAAFSPVNWPHLCELAGEPAWTPPAYGCGWLPVTPEEHAEAVRHGREVEARYAAMEQAGAP